MKKIKVLFIMAIASIFMLTACYQQNGLYNFEYLQAFKYEYQYDEKEEGYTLEIMKACIDYKENASNRNPIEYSKDLVPFGQEELVLPSYYEGKPIVKTSADFEFILNQDKKIKHIVLPQNLKEIGYRAFNGCYSITNIEIPDSVKIIGNAAFSGCSSLTSINIPESVEVIGNAAFSGCSSLTNIEISEGVKEICYDTFYGCSSLTSIHIPESVEVIGSYAFYGCSSLASIHIPESVKEIRSYAFSGCSSLTNIEIPESVKEIGYYAFSDCSSLKNIRILGRLEDVGDGIFAHCTALEKIELSVFGGLYNVRNYFYNYSNVYIFYSGTIEEFKEKFEVYENGEYIIHCSDGDINVGYWEVK